MSASKTPRTLQELDARLKQAEEMESLLRRLRFYLSQTQEEDAPLWQAEIDDVIGSD
jgi:hypothetical protein